MIVSILEYVSVVSLGLVAGSSFYSSLVEIPVRQMMTEQEQLKNWILVYPKASHLLKTLGVCTMILILLTWGITKKIEWFAAAIPLFILIPFTSIFIAKINTKLVNVTADSDVLGLIKKWDQYHHIRTLLTIASLLISTIKF